jgi:hypothetical protein
MGLEPSSIVCVPKPPGNILSDRPHVSCRILYRWLYTRIGFCREVRLVVIVGSVDCVRREAPNTKVCCDMSGATDEARIYRYIERNPFSTVVTKFGLAGRRSPDVYCRALLNWRRRSGIPCWSTYRVGCHDTCDSSGRCCDTGTATTNARRSPIISDRRVDIGMARAVRMHLRNWAR